MFFNNFSTKRYFYELNYQFLKMTVKSLPQSFDVLMSFRHDTLSCVKKNAFLEYVMYSMQNNKIWKPELSNDWQQHLRRCKKDQLRKCQMHGRKMTFYKTVSILNLKNKLILYWKINRLHKPLKKQQKHCIAYQTNSLKSWIL